MTESTDDLISVVLTEPVMMDGEKLPPGTGLEVEPELWAELKKWNAAQLASDPSKEDGASGEAAEANLGNSGTDTEGMDALPESKPSNSKKAD